MSLNQIFHNAADEIADTISERVGDGEGILTVPLPDGSSLMVVVDTMCRQDGTVVDVAYLSEDTIQDMVDTEGLVFPAHWQPVLVARLKE